MRNPKKVNLLRYKETNVISTRLDVLEETMNYLSFFRSLEFTEDNLLKTHNIRNAAKRKILAKEIKEHISLSIDLANQAFNSKEELSYLPLYYSCLNLIKAHLLFMNKKEDLYRNLKHGMSYNEKLMRRDFFNEELTFYKDGVVPFYYRTISGKTITNSERIRIKIKDVYAKIKDIYAEYLLLSSGHSQIIELKGGIIEYQGEEFIKLIKHSSRYENLPSLRSVSSINNFKLHPDKQLYLSKEPIINENQIEKYINDNINKYYISNYFCNNCKEFHLYTFVSGAKHVFNEELSIALAYFHLSNIIRYNPIHYRKLVDSKYNPLITALRKNGYFTFIKSMIGHFHKVAFDVNI